MRSLIPDEWRKRGVLTLEQRFWNRVNKGLENDCWLWTGAINHNGYGVIQRGRNEGLVRVHRLSYEIHYGPITDKYLCVCHSCDVRNCVNPKHLFIGNDANNKEDMIVKDRAPVRNTKGQYNSKIGQDL